MMNSVAVIYLSWLPYGISEFEGFLHSYKLHPAGASHQLILLFNGVNSEEDYEPFLVHAENELGFRPQFMVYEKGQDIEAYFYAARNLNHEYLLFLNTYSRIMANDWLQKYLLAFQADDHLGLLSASASALSYYSAVFQKNTWQWETDKSFSNQFRKYKLFLKALLYWRFLFNAFPNYHIRTNAFMIRRSLMLQIKCPALTSKFKAYLFESGYQSFTNQVLQLGSTAQVIDRNGTVHKMDECSQLPVFWKGSQELLLVSDNQSRKYDEADLQAQAFMRYLAWGEKSTNLRRVEL